MNENLVTSSSEYSVKIIESDQELIAHSKAVKMEEQDRGDHPQQAHIETVEIESQDREGHPHEAHPDTVRMDDCSQECKCHTDVIQIVGQDREGYTQRFSDDLIGMDNPIKFLKVSDVHTETMAMKDQDREGNKQVVHVTTVSPDAFMHVASMHVGPVSIPKNQLY